MATETRGSSNGFLYFIVGALLIAVAVLAFVSYNGSLTQTREDAAIERSADAISDAARDIGDSVDDATRRAAVSVPAPQPTQPAEPEPAPPT